MSDTFLDSLVTPTLAMYGAAGKTKGRSVPAATAALVAPAPVEPAPAPTPDEPSTAKTIAMGVAGLAVATGVAAGVNALVGSRMYPRVGGAPFAKTGAISYALPAGLLMGASFLYKRAQKKGGSTN